MYKKVDFKIFEFLEIRLLEPLAIFTLGRFGMAS